LSRIPKISKYKKLTILNKTNSHRDESSGNAPAMENGIPNAGRSGVLVEIEADRTPGSVWTRSSSFW
jgi:hypothetical protein